MPKWIAIGRKRESFEERLVEREQRAAFRELLRKALVQGAGLSVLALLAALYFQLKELYIICLALASFLLPPVLHYSLRLYLEEQRKRGIERLVPDVLLQASVFPSGTPMTRIVKYLGEASYGELSQEFRKAHTELLLGSSVEEALGGMAKRVGSQSLSRALNLLVQGYNSGADMSQTFKEAAEDLLETQSILRERVSSLVVEKYTLLLAGGVIVPLVLALISGIVSGLNFDALPGLDLGLDARSRKELLNAALLGNQGYIAEYALIASLFIANQENNLRKAVLYALFLLPLSLAVYNLA